MHTGESKNMVVIQSKNQEVLPGSKVEGVGGGRGRQKVGGEMAQTLYAHKNK
jgi:hypothetical protein